jgi:hypothetical protein
MSLNGIRDIFYCSKYLTNRTDPVFPDLETVMDPQSSHSPQPLVPTGRHSLQSQWQSCHFSVNCPSLPPTCLGVPEECAVGFQCFPVPNAESPDGRVTAAPRRQSWLPNKDVLVLYTFSLEFLKVTQDQGKGKGGRRLTGNGKGF